MKKLLLILLAVTMRLGAASVHPGDGWVGVGSDGLNVYKVNSGTFTTKVDAQGSSVVAWLASSYVYASSTAFQATTAGLAVNISHVAGAACNDCKAYWQSNAAGYWDFGNSASIPATLGATTGFTLSANVTPLLDSSFIDGQFLHVKGQTGTVQFTVTVRKRQ